MEGGVNMRKDFLVVYSQDNSIKEELKTREELQTLLSDEDIEIISVNDKFPTYLYHLTTEENLEKILKDGKLIPKYNNLYFASNIESCVHLANPATYTKYKAIINSKLLEVNDFVRKYGKKDIFNIEEVKKRKFPILKIPKCWFDDIDFDKNMEIRKTLGHIEYVYNGELEIRNHPEIFYYDWVQHKDGKN